MALNWQPSATIANLKARAQFLADVRRFFYDKDVMEVETPILSHGTVTDVHLDAFQTEFHHASTGHKQTLYMQTSPEYAMKRLLAAGSGAIYQIGKAFRHEPTGRFHNPEFTMLEWYRPNFNDQQLMDEIDELVVRLLRTKSAIRVTYQQAFLEHTSIDPLEATREKLLAFIKRNHDDEWLLHEPLDTLLQWIFATYVEPNLGDEKTPCFIYDFPATQASLARINQNDNRVAHRFELYFKGVELANGFYELQDAAEQKRRFDNDNELRAKNGLEVKPIDRHFLAALEHGLPDCSGVALGVDRLFMLQQNLTSIDQAISFSNNRA